jgi:hypothetical protein
MSVEYSNLIEVTGPRSEVLRFRRDARRKLPPRLAKEFNIDVVELSLEELFHRHNLAAPSDAGIPSDFGIYFGTVGRIRKLEDSARLDYSLVVKNYEIYCFLIPLSCLYPALCFVDAQACEGEEIMSTFITKGRVSVGAFQKSFGVATSVAQRRLLEFLTSKRRMTIRTTIMKRF